MKTNNINNNSKDEIDLIKHLRDLWFSRIFIFKVVFVFTILGVIIAVFSEKEYTAYTTFVPQSSKKTNRGLSGLAALAGVDIGNISKESSVSPHMYPQIVTNILFQKEMLETLITIKGQNERITYKEYYENVYKPSSLTYVKKYTIGLPKIIINLFKKKNFDNNVFDKKKSLIQINEKDKSLIDLLNNQLLLNVNTKEGYITLSAKMPEAKAATEITNRAQKLLENYVIDFKIKKAKQQLSFIRNRYLEKEKKFKEIQQKLAIYIDQNQNVNSARAKTKLMYLQSEYDLAYGIYSELAKRLEAQEIKVKEDTPVFTIIEPAYVPLNKTKPKRIIIVFIWFFLGLILSIGYLLLKAPIQEVLYKIKFNNN